MTLRIIIADDHPIVRIGARTVIESKGVGQVVAEASSVEGLMQALSSQSCDVLVTDWSMPDSGQVDGLSMISHIRRRFPALPVLVLSVHNNLAMLKTLRMAGVLGLFDKNSSMDELPLAIQTVHRGQPYMSPGLKERLGLQADDNADTQPLSLRETEVLRLLGSGVTVKEIARQLHRSESTVSRQKDNAMRKLGLKSDEELFNYLRDGKL